MMYYVLSALILSAIQNVCLLDIEQHPNYNRLPVNECGESMSDRIVGGSQAHLGQYPWLARLGYTLTNCSATQMKPQFKCSGSLITDQYVLSAAHCVSTHPMRTCKETGLTDTLMLTHIRLGELNADEDIDCDDNMCADPTQNFMVIDIVYHNSYDNPPLKFDIALIKLHKKAVFTDWVSPICLPLGEMLTANFTGEIAEVAGWGIMDIHRNVVSNILLYIRLPIIDISHCINHYPHVPTLNMAEICAGGIIGEDSCSGDSGGPLMVISTKLGLPRYYQLGIVSFGVNDCGASYIPAVYTNVPYYITWILDNMKYGDD